MPRLVSETKLTKESSFFFASVTCLCPVSIFPFVVQVKGPKRMCQSYQSRQRS